MQNKNLFVIVSVLCLLLNVNTMAEQKVSAMLTGKMNDNGDYIPIRGINFIAMADGIWRDEVHHAVQDHAPVLGSYINPLPGSSYHMTVHPLFTEHSLPEFFMKKYAPNWESMWMHIMNILTPHIITLKRDIPEKLHAEYVRPLVGNGVTVLVLKLPREEATAMSEFRARIRDTIGAEMLKLLLDNAKTMEERVSSQEWYDQVFVEPSQPSAAMSYKYHLTLGYSRILAENLATAQLNALDEESDMVDAVVHNLVCPDYEKPGDKCVLVLEHPTFDWFNSMTAFDEIQFAQDENNKDKPKLKMFYRLFPMEDDPYISHTFTKIVWVLSFCVVVILFFILRKRNCFKMFKSKRQILPITTVKSSQHEA